MPDIIPGSGGPWRVVVLDGSADDPKWLIATITLASDVRSAVLDAAGRCDGWAEVTAWVALQVGRAVSLVPTPGALAWNVTEGGQPR